MCMLAASPVRAALVASQPRPHDHEITGHSALDLEQRRQPQHTHLSQVIMSTSRSQGQDRVQQDYIARVRYSNTLPPPPNPPKLLDVPNTGLASGQYTAPGFAARLAREQPLNIEAGAELGMHLDLVGMPGVFDGDESCKYNLINTKLSRRTNLRLRSYTMSQGGPSSAPK